MNRFLAFLLAFIVAVAALTPCCGEEDCSQETATAGQHKDATGDDGGACSPFFACATCPGFISTAKAISIPAPAVHRFCWYEIVLPYFSSAYSSVPWQPPRAA